MPNTKRTTIDCPDCTGRRLPKWLKKRSERGTVWVCVACSGSGLLTPKQQRLKELNDDLGNKFEVM